MNFPEEFSSLKVINSNGNESTIEIENTELHGLMRKLRDDDNFHFETLIDLCGVDYLDYGKDEWETKSVTSEGFSRGVTPSLRDGVSQSEVIQEEDLDCRVAKAPRNDEKSNDGKIRFAVVYHLLSIKNNKRLRVRCYASCMNDMPPVINSVVEIWSSANWYEREAFDLYGILFDGHPDLRRLLTDYGFIGHPFRKDFPVSGNVEVKYDEEEGRVVYQPVSIEPRVLVPKVIREDSRYVGEK